MARFSGVIFDLDGVITKTALVHSTAWKEMFDNYLKDRAERLGEAFKPFKHSEDYLPYVDGKPRYKGVQSFLESRGIDIPFGDPSDSPELETVCGLGNRKNTAFNDILARDGVEVYPSTLELIKKCKLDGIRIGVASSSKNCKAVLEAADLLHYFETRVDGVVSAEIGLQGKPEPDIFTTAADNLGLKYDETVVVEDAVSGVQAGAKGNFGLVLGVAREENVKELWDAGADIVVEDIGEIAYEGIVDWFEYGLEEDLWSITYNNYVPEKEKSRESLLTIGNGHFGTRGSMEEVSAGAHNYPGTYMASLYNRLVSKVGDKDIENEDFVNAINWPNISFKIDNGYWIDPNKCEVLEIKRTLQFLNGVLYRKLVIRDDTGRITRIDSRRFASMDDAHIAAMEYRLTPMNYNATITLKSGLYANHKNTGVERYNSLNQQHLKGVIAQSHKNELSLTVKTTESGTLIANSSKHLVFLNDEPIEPAFYNVANTNFAELGFSVELEKGNNVKVEKIMAIAYSLEPHIDDPFSITSQLIKVSGGFNSLLNASETKWDELWAKADVQLKGDRMSQKLLRLHIYHMLITISPHNEWLDAGIPARGLHGEAYRGHIFWDELYILPFYYMHLPESAKSVLMYRYRRLNEARKYAEKHGYKGAMFPWQSGSSGREETQILHLNPVSGKWGDDHSSLQRHISIAVAYNIYQYYHYTGDKEFMQHYGLETFLEICRFWVSKAVYNVDTARYEIKKVMGPDEFHEMYPDAKEGGLKDNAYTNIMVAWLLAKAKPMIEELESDAVIKKLDINDKELLQWFDILSKLSLCISEEGIIAQYDGYFDLKELDWDSYREKYKNIYRMDRILKAEGKSADEFKVAKQADTLMTFYNLDQEDVDMVLSKMNYKLPEGYLEKNLHYYLQRTSHGSTLSRVVHAQLASMVGDLDLSWKLYSDALASDFNDIQGGTTAEGIHAGVMAGTVLIAMFTYGGLNLKGKYIHINPLLPEKWEQMAFTFNFKGNQYSYSVSKSEVKLELLNETDEKQLVYVNDKQLFMESGNPLSISFS